jgi:hypothetical protein
MAMGFKFSSGAKLLRDNGTEEDLEGVDFEVRPLTNLVRIEAARAKERMDSTMDIEIARASIVSVRGQAVKGEWPDWTHANVQATADVDRAFATVNGFIKAAGADPLQSGSGGNKTT